MFNNKWKFDVEIETAWQSQWVGLGIRYDWSFESYWLILDLGIVSLTLMAYKVDTF